MKKYVLRNINQGNYLKIKYGSKHYILYKKDATKFTSAQAIAMRNSFRHPKFWEIIDTTVKNKKEKKKLVWKKN